MRGDSNPEFTTPERGGGNRAHHTGIESTSVKVIVPMVAHPSACLLATYLYSLSEVSLFDDIPPMIRPAGWEGSGSLASFWIRPPIRKGPFEPMNGSSWRRKRGGSDFRPRRTKLTSVSEHRLGCTSKWYPIASFLPSAGKVSTGPTF